MLSKHEIIAAQLLTTETKIFRDFAKNYLPKLDYIELRELWVDIDNDPFLVDINNSLLVLGLSSIKLDRVIYFRCFHRKRVLREKKERIKFEFTDSQRFQLYSPYEYADTIEEAVKIIERYYNKIKEISE